MLLGLIVLLVWASIRAAAAVRRRNEKMERERKTLERMKRLAQTYGDATPQQLKDADPAEAVEGVAAALQRRIEREPDLIAAFSAAPRWQQQCYALQYLLEDGAEKPSAFYRKNGNPITGIATELVCAAMPQTAKDLRALYAMLDDDNDRVSVDRERIAQADASLSGCWAPDDVAAKCLARIIEENQQ